VISVLSSSISPGPGIGPIPKSQAAELCPFVDDLPQNTEFICYSLDEKKDADDQVAEFERSLHAEMPPTASVVEVPDVAVQSCIVRNSHVFIPPPQETPTAPLLTSSMLGSPLGTMTLQQFLDDCKNNPIAMTKVVKEKEKEEEKQKVSRNPEDPMHCTDVDLVSLICPDIEPECAPILTNESILSGWVKLDF